MDVAKIKVSIDPNSMDWLDTLPGSVKKGLYDGVAEAMQLVEAESKSSFGKPGNLNVRTGNLRRSIKSESNDNTGKLSSTTEYTAIHELGGVIKPKVSSYLRFKIGGKWKTVKEVIMPARPFLLPAFEDNMDDISNLIINKIFGEM
jgi:phage gpG-like protein